MIQDLNTFKTLTDAEEYLAFFQLPYSGEFVNVNRLHILKKFSQYVKEIDANYVNLSEEERLNAYSLALQKAYEVFLTSTPLQQKLFKVFNDKPQNVVMLGEITAS